MGVMSTKFFGAFIGGMSADFSNIEDIKGVGKGFSDVFSDKDFEGKDSNYPYSQEYFEDMRDNAKLMLEEAWGRIISKMNNSNLSGASGSEAIRQARLNANDMIKKPNKVNIKDYEKN